MKFTINIKVGIQAAEYLVSKKENANYLATLTKPLTEPEFILPRQLVLKKEDGKWICDHVLGLILGDAIDRFKIENGQSN